MSNPTKIGHQAPGKFFAWPNRWRLTALQDAILAIPAAILSEDEVIGSVIHCDDEAKLNLPQGLPSESSPPLILIWLKRGQSVYLTKSCQAMVIPSYEGDKAVRRFALSRVED